MIELGLVCLGVVLSQFFVWLINILGKVDERHKIQLAFAVLGRNNLAARKFIPAAGADDPTLGWAMRELSKHYYLPIDSSGEVAGYFDNENCIRPHLNEIKVQIDAAASDAIPNQ